MRYTTVIDISEIPALYRNKNARMIYFHLALRAGYHDDDRDVVKQSIRVLAAETGITVSATRHALHVLEKAGLLTHDNGTTKVVKWVMMPTITARARSVKEQKQKEIQEIREREQRQFELSNRKRTDQERQDDLIEAYEKFLQQQRDGTIGAVGRAFLEQNRDKYNQLTKQS